MIFLIRMYLLTVAVITLCAGLVYGQSSQCQTPDGKSGDCISLLKCRPLREQLNKPNKTDQDLFLLSKLLTKLHCGSVRVPFLPKVCCASKQQDSEAEAVYSNGTCIAHDGRPGKCISLLMCPYLEDMIVNGRGSTLWEKSKCKIPEGSICCPNEERPGESADCKAKTTAFPPDPKSGCCGHWEGDDNIAQVGLGTLVVEHPWLALIVYNQGHKPVYLCAGSLISGKYVLTAAHCIDEKSILGKPKLVRLGQHFTEKKAECTTDPPLQTPSVTIFSACVKSVSRSSVVIVRGIAKTIPHPGYIHKLLTPWHDIGLIRLTDTVSYTDFVRPICLPAKDPTQPVNSPSYSSMYAVGWDVDEFTRGQEFRTSAIMWCLRESNDRIPPFFRFGKGQLCAAITEAIDNCTSDKGGPLAYEHQKRFQLIGVKSFGPVCIEKDLPGVYTNVYEYLDWIKSVIIE